MNGNVFVILFGAILFVIGTVMSTTSPPSYTLDDIQKCEDNLEWCELEEPLLFEMFSTSDEDNANE